MQIVRQIAVSFLVASALAIEHPASEYWVEDESQLSLLAQAAVSREPARYRSISAHLLTVATFTAAFTAAFIAYPAAACDVLFLVCSPNRRPLNLLGEALSVATHLPTAILHQGTLHAMREALYLLKPRIFIFGGHARRGTLALTDIFGRFALSSGAAIARTVGLHATSRGGHLTLVILNACNTLEIGRQLVAEGVAYVVVWRTRVETAAAAVFVVALCRALSLGYDITTAFNMAKAVTALTNDLCDPDAPRQAPGMRQAAGVPVLLAPLALTMLITIFVIVDGKSIVMRVDHTDAVATL